MEKFENNRNADTSDLIPMKTWITNISSRIHLGHILNKLYITRNLTEDVNILISDGTYICALKRSIILVSFTCLIVLNGTRSCSMMQNSYTNSWVNHDIKHHNGSLLEFLRNPYIYDFVEKNCNQHLWKPFVIKCHNYCHMVCFKSPCQGF